MLTSDVPLVYYVYQQQQTNKTRYSIMSNTDQTKGQQLAAWCRAHDWGREASYSEGRIIGLWDSETDSFISLPADRDTVRAWAGY